MKWIETVGRAAHARLRRVDHLRAHCLPLVATLVACGVGQLAVLTQAPLVSISNDSPQYVAIAERMLTVHQFIDAYRTPTYPALLALIFWLAGGRHLDIVVVVQAVLIMLTAAEVYVLTWRIARQRWIAAVVAAICGVDVFAVTWERVIMTESLSYWLMVTLFVVFERYLRLRRISSLVWFGVLSVAAILTRPIFVLLPALMLLVVAVWSLRTRARRHQLKPALMSLAVIYMLVLGYIGANGLTTGYFGLSDASNIDLFARVLRYDLYALPVSTGNPQFAVLQQRIIEHVERGGVLAREPWAFVQQFPQYAGGHMELLAAFSRAEIEQHPLDYAMRSAPDIIVGFYADPYLYAPTSNGQWWIMALDIFFHFYSRTHAFYPLLLLAAVLRVFRHPQRTERLALLIMVLAYGEVNVMATSLSYEGFWRLQFPMEWAMTLAGTVMLVEIVHLLAARLANWRSRRAQIAPGRSMRGRP